MPRFMKLYRKGRGKKIKKTKGGRAKQLVDGKYSGYISAGVAAIPYLIKSVRLLKQLVNSEEHYIDIASNATYNNTGTIVYLSSVAVGDTDVTRTGNKVLFKDIIFRFNLYGNNAQPNTTTRVILFIDKENDGVLPNVTDVLMSASPLAPVNINFSKRYVILKTWLVTFSNTGKNDFSSKCYKILNFHGNWDGTSNTIADAKENQIFALILSDTSSSNPGYSLYSRIKFYDN